MYPNYRFVMLAPGRKLRSNQVIFKVPLQLNKFQIKNYLEEVYSVKVGCDGGHLLHGGSRGTRHLLSVRVRGSACSHRMRSDTTCDSF